MVLNVEDIERLAYLNCIRFLFPFDEKLIEMGAEEARLIQEADAVAYGIDVQQEISVENDRLESIFNRFGQRTSESQYFPLMQMSVDKGAYPQAGTEGGRKTSIEQIGEKLRKEFLDKPPCERSLPDFARLIELSCSYLPAQSSGKIIPDVSMYEHAKLTAAVAACLYLYGEETEQRNYPALREQNTYLLVSGDISGVQKFIYTIPSKGALKSLRGRSFYLEILLEHMADEILAHAGVSRSCLLYTGGGHFYLLVPNTQNVLKLLEQFAHRVNDWFLRHTGSRLYLAMAWTPCSALEFMGKSCSAGAPFRRVSQQLSANKLCRYSEDQLRKMFDPESSVNCIRDQQRECSICHTSTSELLPYGEDDGEIISCPSCRNLYCLGHSMLSCDAFLVSEERSESAVPVPGFERDLYLSAVNWQDLGVADDKNIRLYVKNQQYVKRPKAIYLNLADYISRDDSGHVLEFSELADLSGGALSSSGIRRLGVMRADVDNLGAAFIAGFAKEYATLSRMGALSRQLSLFFKRYIMFICEGKIDMPGRSETRQFSLFGEKKQSRRNVHIIYSGGDDMFLVGAWDDIIELAVDIRRAFGVFTNGKLSFSAGIGFFPAKCPVAVLARDTGELEDAAKGNPGKDSLALFGASTEVKSSSHQSDAPQRFSWERFVGKVVGEKLRFLQENFAFSAQEKEMRPHLLRIGKSGIYKMLSLLEDAEEEGAINLARFAYMLGLMAPGRWGTEGEIEIYQGIRSVLYEWYKSKESREELRTALELMVYHMRKKGAE